MNLKLLLAMFVVSSIAWAIPLQFTHQGMLTNSAGSALNGAFDLTFRLYDGPAPADSLVWAETHPAVPVTEGLYAVNLGASVPLADGILSQPELWLGVTVGLDQEMAPRIRVMSTPYAICAWKADTVTVDNLKDLIQIWAVTPDADGDGHSKVAFGGDDCDDWRPDLSPGAIELCDGIDNNCNGQIDEGFSRTWYFDADGDGYGTNSNSITSCDSVPGYTRQGNDCNDNNASFNPGAYDICDLQDNNCDGTVDENGSLGTWYHDLDGDGYGDSNSGFFGCPSDSTWTENGGDCDEANPAVNPGAVEECNGLDDNCNLYVDEDTPECVMYYVDLDLDGWGDMFNDAICLCAPNYPFTTTQYGDCEDGNSLVNPGVVEICDGIDNNCDGQIDPIGSQGCTDYWQDFDHDGFGDTYMGCRCVGDEYWTSNGGGDCDDGNPAINPGAGEICGDSIDNDCDGLIDATDPDCQ
ncbi:MAG: putative metal-binding motif-containing protein [bacterium]|nr:putative metal-binding motif-containing protein [bacterium]